MQQPLFFFLCVTSFAPKFVTTRAKLLGEAVQTGLIENEPFWETIKPAKNVTALASPMTAPCISSDAAVEKLH